MSRLSKVEQYADGRWYVLVRSDPLSSTWWQVTPIGYTSKRRAQLRADREARRVRRHLRVEERKAEAEYQLMRALRRRAS